MTLQENEFMHKSREMSPLGVNNDFPSIIQSTQSQTPIHTCVVTGNNRWTDCRLIYKLTLPPERIFIYKQWALLIRNSHPPRDPSAPLIRQYNS